MRPLNDTGVVVALSDEETLTDAIATDEEAKDGVLVVLTRPRSTLRWAVRWRTTACRPARVQPV